MQVQFQVQGDAQVTEIAGVEFLVAVFWGPFVTACIGFSSIPGQLKKKSDEVSLEPIRGLAFQRKHEYQNNVTLKSKLPPMRRS